MDTFHTLMFDALRRECQSTIHILEKKPMRTHYAYIMQNMPQLSRANQIAILNLIAKYEGRAVISEYNMGTKVDLEGLQPTLIHKIRNAIAFYISK